MFFSLWRRLQKNNKGPAMKEGPQRRRSSSFQPRLEALEDRVMPTLSPGMVVPVVPAGATSGIHAATVLPLVSIPVAGASSSGQEIQAPLAGSTNKMNVTVSENAAATIIDLAPVFAKMSGLQYEDGLHLSLLCNTNSSLVTATLSGEELALKYASGKWGGASITVGATDADGVSVEETILVSVIPGSQAYAGTVPPALAAR